MNANAGGWPLPVGSGEIIISFTRTEADERYDSSGDKRWTSRYTKHEISPYAEYGLTKRITLVGELAYTREKTDFFGYDFRDSAISRYKLGARFALGTWQDTLFSLQPMHTHHLMSASDDPAATGDGDNDWELALILARNEELFGHDIFTVQEVAYQLRDSGRPDKVRADFTIGTRVMGETLILVKSLNIAAIEKTENDEFYQSNRLGLSLVHPLPFQALDGWQIEAGVEKMLHGRSTIHDTTFKIGLWHRF